MKPEKPARRSYDDVMRRVGYLRSLNEPAMMDRWRIRALARGGKNALEVLLGDLPTTDDTLPAANLIRSGIERFSEMISPAPDLRIDPPQHNDNSGPRKAAEKRERILSSHDERCNLAEQLVQMSLWVPGYGFGSWRVCERYDESGYAYPRAELRDPYLTWPAEWGVDQRPVDVAYQRWVDPEVVAATYPHAKPALEARFNSRRFLPGGGVDLSSVAATGKPGWDGNTGGVEIIEYVDAYGVYIVSPVVDQFLDVYEHPLNRAPFVVPRRFSFDTLTGQFTDAIGLAKVMAKLTLLTQIVMEDAAFAPLVVSGRPTGPVRKGRDSIIQIEGGDAKYVYQNFPYQMFTEIDRIEGHLRGNTGYSKQADGESPISFVTGQGLEELGSSLTRQVERYQLSFSRALEELDRMRLEWDEVAYAGEKRPLEGFRKGAAFAEQYDPAEIKGQYRTRRVYGLMAAWDDARKIVGGLQLLSAGVIDLTTLRENLRGLDNVPKIEDRSIKDRAKEVLFEGILAGAQQGDPTAIRAALKAKKTGDLDSAIEEFYGVADEEEMVEEAGMALPEQPPGLGQLLGGQGQFLARLTQGGEAAGGVQVKGEL